MKKTKRMTGLSLLLAALLLAACGMEPQTSAAQTTPAPAETTKASLPAETTTAEVKPSASVTPETTTAEIKPAETTAPETDPIADLSSQREEILAGKIVALNEDGALYDGFGFKFDLIAGGAAETITVREGFYRGGSTGWELYCDDSETGYSSFLARMDQVPIFPKLEWPDEGNFSKDAGCRLYLVSPDGKKVCLAVSQADEIVVLNFVYLEGDDLQGKPVAAVARMRGIGKKIEDLNPGKSLEDYIADGWEVRPSQGDEIDLSGDGVKERLSLAYEKFTTFREYIGINVAALQGTKLSYSLKDSNNTLLYDLRYEKLFYIPAAEGGYALQGEITLNGEKITTVWTAEKNADGILMLNEKDGN